MNVWRSDDVEARARWRLRRQERSDGKLVLRVKRVIVDFASALMREEFRAAKKRRRK